MSELEVARAWQVWAAANLLRGASATIVVERLVNEGVTADMARALVESISASPAIEAAGALRVDARRFGALTALQDRQLRAALHPTRVIEDDALTPERFYDLFVATGMPVVAKGLARAAFDLSQWSPRGLADRFGDVSIDATVDRQRDEEYGKSFRRRTRSMQVCELVERMERSADEPSASRGDVYVVAENRALAKTRLGELRDEIHFPEGWVDDAALRSDEGTKLWLGPAGTFTTLHHDASNVLFCQLHGRKRFRLVAPADPALLARVSAPHTTLSAGDIEGALVKEVLVEPGDALFLPAGFWHEVTALDPSCSVSVTALARGAGTLPLRDLTRREP